MAFVIGISSAHAILRRVHEFAALSSGVYAMFSSMTGLDIAQFCQRIFACHFFTFKAIKVCSVRFGDDCRSALGTFNFQDAFVADLS